MDKRTTELICKAVDGLATPSELEELRRMAAENREIERELQIQREAADAVGHLGLPESDDALQADFWRGVYNRIEYRAGWTLVVIGVAVLVAYALYELLTDPAVSAFYRIGIAAVVVGFVLLFSGVCRVRMRLQRSDKYREVLR